jgi:Flp pilus assembly pilin Flp
MARRLLKDEAGAVLVEFTIMAPLLLLLMAGMADLGGMLYVRFKLNEAVSAAAAYAFVHSSEVNASTADAFATGLANLIDTNLPSAWATSTVNINQVSAASVSGGTASLTSGGGDIDSCYCPTPASHAADFGATVNCGDACANGGQAARFIWLETSHHYDPIFAGYGIVADGNVKVTALIPINQ